MINLNTLTPIIILLITCGCHSPTPPQPQAPERILHIGDVSLTQSQYDRLTIGQKRGLLLRLQMLEDARRQAVYESNQAALVEQRKARAEWYRQQARKIQIDIDSQSRTNKQN